MPTTTTFKAIRNAWITDLIAITPTSQTQYGFDHCPKQVQIRDWAPRAKGACLRKFQFQATGHTEPMDAMDPAAYTRNESATLTIAYPVSLGLYGTDDFNSMEDVIAEDVASVRDVLTSQGNYTAGQHRADVSSVSYDRSDDSAWFVELSVEIIFSHAQSLT